MQGSFRARAASAARVSGRPVAAQNKILAGAAKPPRGSLGPAGFQLGKPKKGSGPIKGYGGATAPPFKAPKAKRKRPRSNGA